MKAQIKITDSAKFTDADVNDLKFNSGSWNGTVVIEINGVKQSFTGQHGSHDYENDFGFVIEPKNN